MTKRWSNTMKAVFVLKEEHGPVYRFSDEPESFAAACSIPKNLLNKYEKARKAFFEAEKEIEEYIPV